MADKSMARVHLGSPRTVSLVCGCVIQLEAGTGPTGDLSVTFRSDSRLSIRCNYQLDDLTNEERKCK